MYKRQAIYQPYRQNQYDGDDDVISMGGTIRRGKARTCLLYTSSHMKVVAMTAHDASIIRELKEAGFDDCLFKPFSTEKLKEILGLEDAASETEDMAEETRDICLLYTSRCV